MDGTYFKMMNILRPTTRSFDPSWNGISITPKIMGFSGAISDYNG
jgi:hypothetical protein